MDAVHKRSEEEASTSVLPRREDITDTMIFSPSDLVTMICRDVDLNYATRGTNTHMLRARVARKERHKYRLLTDLQCLCSKYIVSPEIKKRTLSESKHWIEIVPRASLIYNNWFSVCCR